MKDQIIVALDYPSLKECKDFISKLEGRFDFFKVGMELFYAEGPRVIDYLKQQNFRLFLDLKLMDIPTTVSRSLKVLDKLGVDFINVHALGGEEMLLQARSALSHSKLLGVTILTSFDETSYAKLGFQVSLSEKVIELGQNCAKAKLAGVVCAASDLSHMRDNFDKDFLFITPGIRLHAQKSGDQKRVLTPKEALKRGADFIVMGRELTRSHELSKTLQQLEDNLYGSKYSS